VEGSALSPRGVDRWHYAGMGSALFLKVRGIDQIKDLSSGTCLTASN
jgi:hypothetical protein